MRAVLFFWFFYNIIKFMIASTTYRPIAIFNHDSWAWFRPTRYDSWLKINLGSRVWNLRFGLSFKVWDLGDSWFRAQSLGCLVWDWRLILWGTKCQNRPSRTRSPHFYSVSFFDLMDLVSLCFFWFLIVVLISIQFLL